MILEFFTSGPFQNNVVVVGCKKTKKAAIFDPAFDSKEKIDSLLLKYNLKPIGIYLTHSHWDHIANCDILKQTYKIPLFVHELDAENVKRPGVDKVPLLFPVDGTEVDGFIKDGEHVNIGMLNFEVIHTPGHSPGGVCFYEKKHKLLISGDTLFKGTMGNLSLPTANQNDMLQSLKKISILPSDTMVIPGHGNTTSIGKEKWLDNLDQILS